MASACAVDESPCVEAENRTPEDELVDYARTYAGNVIETLDAMFGLEIEGAGEVVTQMGIETGLHCQISVPFLGTVRGEFILAFDPRSMAEKIGLVEPGATSQDLLAVSGDLGAAFGEALNGAAGSSIEVLSPAYPHLTLAPPSVTFGTRLFPGVYGVRVDLRSGEVAIECHFYIDRMKLAISDSYSQALSREQRALAAADSGRRTIERIMAHSSSGFLLFGPQGELQSYSDDVLREAFGRDESSADAGTIFELIDSVAKNPRAALVLKDWYLEVLGADAESHTEENEDDDDAPFCRLSTKDGGTLAFGWAVQRRVDGETSMLVIVEVVDEGT